MRGTHLTALLLASVSTLAIAVPAFAEAPAADAPSANTVQEVVVTAEKRSELQRNVPMSVSALPQDKLEKLDAKTFEDYTKLVPGLSLESANPGAARLTLRGLNAGGVASTVATYVDESPFGSSSGLVNGAVLAADFDTFDMQRLEVLRGPQGTLYGANTEGGLIKFVTNAPSTGGFAAAAQAGFRSVAHGDSGWNAEGMVNIPLGDTLALRISGYHDKIPGWVDNTLTGQKDVNGGDKTGGRASLLWKPTPDLSVRLTAFGQNMNFGGNSGVDVNENTLQPVTNLYENGTTTIGEPHHYQYRVYNGTINYDMGWASLVSSTSFGQVHTNYVQDDTRADIIPGLPIGTYINLLLAPAFGLTPPLSARFDNKVDDDKFTQELRLTSKKGDHFEWQVGGYFTRETGNITQSLRVAEPGVAGTPVAAVPDLEDPLLVSTYKELAVFGNGTYHFTPKWDVQFGARYSTIKQDVTETVTGLLLGGATLTFPGKSTEDVATWSLGSRYHLDDNTMLYVRAATGYRPGGPNVLPPNAPPGTPTSYKSDSNVSYEAGIKTTQLDGRLTADVSAYYIKWNQVQLFEVVNGFGVNGNGGTAVSNGWEWQLNWVPLQGLTFAWTGAYTNAVLTSDAPGAGAVKGDSLPWAPKVSSALDGEYDFHVGETNMFVGGTLAYTGSRSVDFGAISPRVRMPDYDTIDMRIGADFNRYRVELYGRNLQDTRAFTAYGGSPTLTSHVGSVGLIQPRTFGVTVSGKF
jgi:outer membrane receptor protein involved in Fe transport